MSWRKVKLSEIFDIARGGSPRPIDSYISDAPDAVNWVSIKDASESGKYIRSTKLKIKPEGVSKSRLVKPGDFLLTNSMSFGRPYIMQTTGCIHDGWLVLSDKSGGVDPDFLYYLLGSPEMYQEFAKKAAGAVVKNLNIDLVKGVSVSLPPLPVQKKIAAVLEKADELRRKREEQIKRLDDLLQATFLDMFGDPVTNPKGWPIVQIKDFADVRIGPFGSLLHVEDYVENGVPLVNPSHIANGVIVPDQKLTLSYEKFDELSAYALTKGDVVIGRRGEIGRCAVVKDERLFCGTGSMFVRIKNSFIPEILQKIISSDQIKQYLLNQSVGVTMKNLNASIIKELGIPKLPLSLQNQFYNISQRLIQTKQNIQSSAITTSSMFNSLMQRAFKGELELK
ncbi:MAG: Type I restriction-modification system, specificity subunit S [Candidatus Rifleibacterium amylolyticum]|nr:MAG: Type I restriction-modification system, specificity subunit S [Candidatus Rifleibacterium amylolyticum]